MYKETITTDTIHKSRRNYNPNLGKRCHPYIVLDLTDCVGKIDSMMLLGEFLSVQSCSASVETIPYAFG